MNKTPNCMKAASGIINCAKIRLSRLCNKKYFQEQRHNEKRFSRHCSEYTEYVPLKF